MATVPEIDESILDYKTTTYNDYLKGINKDLEDMDKIMNKELYESNRPNGIVNRIFADVFGVLGLYFMLFVLSDFTRVILKGGSFYGLRWLFFGPYYYITEAPLLTRIWESKKFLKDLSEAKNDADFSWPENKSCTQIGNTYAENCEAGDTRGHPIRDKAGDGLDWIIRHTIGKSFGGILGSANCTDQGSTIADDCARDKVQALFAAYNAFCDMYPTLILYRESHINAPNGGSNPDGYDYWDDYSKAAYHIYYDGYMSIYDVGNALHTSMDFPTNLNTAYDSVAFYCYNANKLFGTGPYQGGQQPSYWYLKFPIPSWYPVYGNLSGQDYQDYMCYFQLNYKEHIYDE